MFFLRRGIHTFFAEVEPDWSNGNSAGKKKAEKKTFAVDAKILESLKDVKEGVMVTVTLKDDKVVSVKLAEKKKEEGEKKGKGAK